MEGRRAAESRSGPRDFREAYAAGRTWIVAEIGNVHDGSLGNCHGYIDAVADAGADAVKFQCHIAEAESTLAESFPARFLFHPQDRTRTDYWRRMEFGVSQWMGLCEHAHKRGLEFIVSPFSIEAVTRLDAFVDRWKVASGEVNHQALLKAIEATGKPVILSTGMSTIDEIDGAVSDLLSLALEAIDNVTVLQCTTWYPTPLEAVGLNKVAEWASNICFRCGLSDHSGTIWPSVLAAYLGAHLVEVHVCWDKRQFGCDVSSSLTIDELRQLVAGVRSAEILRKSSVDKTAIASELPDVAVYREGKARAVVSASAGANETTTLARPVA